MYHPTVVAAREAVLTQAYRSALPSGRLTRLPVAQCHALRQDLDQIWDPRQQQPTRPFSIEEQAFVANETLLTKIDFRYAAERYLWINSEGQTLRPLSPFWESQELILQAIARQELAHWETGHPDGLLFNILKGRQLGASTMMQALLAHRTLTHADVRALIASDVPQNSGSEGLFGILELMVAQWPWWLKPKEIFHTKSQHIMFDNGSRVIVESGKSMKGGLKDEGGNEGGEKGQLGRSKTYALAHLSEIPTWERPEQINSSLLPAIPQTPRTLCGREATAMGRNNYWHTEWKLAASGVDPRFFNIFVPFYAEQSKYWLPFPSTWIPSSDTLSFAARVQEVGPLYMYRPISLSKEQLYWYECSKAAAVAREELFRFLGEYPAEPEEAFQYSGRSVFTLTTMSRIERQARPLADLWLVAPHADLAADKDLLVAELKAARVEQAQARRDALQRAQTQVLVDNTPQRVENRIPEEDLP